jgi:hypothetical protein
MTADTAEFQDGDEFLDDGFEERADHVGEEVIRAGTATGDHFDDVVRHLVARGLVLLVGPRGCGKTHLMRYAWLKCIEDKTKPFCIYTSLNRYLSLEPWSQTRTDAKGLFHSWVLARILTAAQETFVRLTEQEDYDVGTDLECLPGQLVSFINRLERNFELEAEDEELHRRLSVEAVKGIIGDLASRAGRKRTVLLLDDAALTLSPAFMTEFLDVLRVIKSPDIAPKCSIYPGTTVFGPRFHADHEGQTVSAWVPTDDPGYRNMMQTIAERRFPEGLASVSQDANALLQYAAFGIPRAYLTLLRDVHTDRSGSGAPSSSNVQALLMRVIRTHRNNRMNEFRSLGEKVVELRTLVRVGERFFEGVVDALRERNDELASKGLKQTTIGISAEDFDPLSTRMIDLLAEAGLLYKEEEVSHGPDRQYRRFTPHFAALIAARAFSGGGRGTSSGKIVEVIGRPSEKHPVRRNFKTVLASQGIQETLKLDLPPCQQCHTARESEKQRFCQNCGTRLVDELIFNRIMAMEITLVPGLSPFLAARVQSANIRTVGELKALQDPGTELRKILKIGEARSTKIIDKVEAYVSEMMS